MFASSDAVPSVVNPTSVRLAMDESATINAMAREESNIYQNIESSRGIQQNFTNPISMYNPGKAMLPFKGDIYRHSAQPNVEPIQHQAIYLKDERVHWTAADAEALNEKRRSRIVMPESQDNRIATVVNHRTKISDADRQKLIDMSTKSLQAERRTMAQAMRNIEGSGRNMGLSRPNRDGQLMYVRGSYQTKELLDKPDGPYEIQMRYLIPATTNATRHAGITQNVVGDASVFASYKKLSQSPLEQHTIDRDVIDRIMKERYTKEVSIEDEIQDILPILLNDLAVSDSRVQALLMGAIDRRMLQEIQEIINTTTLVNDIPDQNIIKLINTYKTMPNDKQLEILVYSIDRYTKFQQLRNVLKQFAKDDEIRLYHLLKDIAHFKVTRLKNIMTTLPEDEQVQLYRYILDYVNYYLAINMRNAELKMHLDHQLNSDQKVLEVLPHYQQQELVKLLKLYASRLLKIDRQKAEEIFSYLNDLPRRMAYKRKQVLEEYFNEMPQEIIYGMENDMTTIKVVRMQNHKQVIIYTPEEVITYIIPDADIQKFVKLHSSRENIMEQLTNRQQTQLLLRYIDQNMQPSKVLRIDSITAAIKIAKMETLDNIMQLATYIDDKYGKELKTNPHATYKRILEDRDPIVVKYLSMDSVRQDKPVHPETFVESRKVGRSVAIHEYDAYGQL